MNLRTVRIGTRLGTGFCIILVMVICVVIADIVISASGRRVAEIMNEITEASQEQSHGIEEINRAIAQMDEMTQRNAALVEQAAAAAEAMEQRASAWRKRLPHST